MEEKKEEKPEEQLTEPEADLPEALLEFQVETREAAIDQILLELKEVEKKNKEYHERNDVLKQEQQACIRHILEQLEEEEEQQDAKEVVTRDDVEELLKANWQYVRDKEQLLEDLRSQIEETEQRLAVKQSERDYWLEYRNVGSKTQANKIMNLEKDIQEVKDDHLRAIEHFKNTLKAVKEENDILIEKHMELSKEKAPENAVRYLDKNICREIAENEWLKEEVKMYQKEVSDLKASIKLLEKENISLAAKLICRLQYLGISRPLFLSQAAEFPKDEMQKVDYRDHEAKEDGEERLGSATVPCEKSKIFAKIQSETENEKPQDSDEELQKSSFSPVFGTLLYEDEEFFQEYLKLHPMETKMMCVVGEAMPIHEEPEEMPSRSHIKDGSAGKSDGHITAQMIKALSKVKVG